VSEADSAGAVNLDIKFYNVSKCLKSWVRKQKGSIDKRKRKGRR